ncbi:hypothetical protein PBY51_001327 [Eleginops maclovinus]|uniref:Phosphatidylinositol-specific phospholipase C X domain-containing protein n=1 Tax=Eleginops maclovinus TaxID=56733 RepID=A0AAN7WXB8_ELEMC|nr:hypothetical protein PBY51_001327 [Eleginops maclovinus]
MSAEKGRSEVRSYSDWMSRLPPELHNNPLYDLTIPGSHDSMSYDLDLSSRIIEPDRLKKLSKMYCVRKLVCKWGRTQEESITKQLDAGVRYLDLRIARKDNDPDPKRLYFYHGLLTHTDVETILRTINEWAERHPREILILSFSHFKGFVRRYEDQLHCHLINFIKTLFGAKLCKRHPYPTLRSCWDNGTNVIISYDYPASMHKEIWGKIPYYYGDSMSITKVESVLRHTLEKERPNKCLFVCGLNLTLPEDIRIIKYIFFRMCDSFTKVIAWRLPRLLRWVTQQGAKTPMNIVASDVVTLDGFVATVVQLNTSKCVKV